MGLTNESSGNRIFLHVFQGKIAQRVQEGTEDAKVRINKDNKTVYEKYYDTLEGRIDDVFSYDGDYGKQWNIVIGDERHDYMLTLPYSSSYANGILFRLHNVDFSDTVKIKTYYIEGEDGKKRGYSTIHQNGKKVEPYFTRENPNGMPDLKQISFKGQLIWDDSDRLTFLEKYVREVIQPKIKGDNPITAKTEKEEVKEAKELGAPNDQELDFTVGKEDDLPF